MVLDMRVSEAALKLSIPRYFIYYWKKIGLIDGQNEDLDFQDILKIRFIDLCKKNGISLQKIRQLITGFKSDKEMENWLPAMVLHTGGHLLVRQENQLLQFETGQLFFREFSDKQSGKLIEKERNFWKSEDSSQDRLKSLEKDYLEAIGKRDERVIRTILSEILSLQKDHVGALIESGNIAFENQKYDDALFFYEKVLVLRSDCVEALYNIANIYYRQKKYAAAIRYFHRCIDLEPDFPESYYNLGIVYLSLKYFEKATAMFDHYLRLDVESAWADQARQFLEDINQVMQEPALFGGAEKENLPVS